MSNLRDLLGIPAGSGGSGSGSDSFAVTKHTGNGALLAGAINLIEFAGSFTLPLADSVPAEYSLIVEIPDEFSTIEPSVSRSGTDTISYSGGTDTSVIFSVGGARTVRFTSDGTSDWRI